MIEGDRANMLLGIGLSPLWREASRSDSLLLAVLGLFVALLGFASSSPVMGTCSGLSKKPEHLPFPCLGNMKTRCGVLASLKLEGIHNSSELLPDFHMATRSFWTWFPVFPVSFHRADGQNLSGFRFLFRLIRNRARTRCDPCQE